MTASHSDPAQSTLGQLIGSVVVLDMATRYVYIGELAAIDHHYLILEQADVRDLRDGTSTREFYVLDSKRFGINPSRERVYVDRTQVVSISRFDDIKE